MVRKNILRADRGRTIHRYAFWAFLITLLLTAFLIIRPFIIAIISAFILAFLVKPVYVVLSGRINKNFAAVFCIFMVVIAVIIPLSLIIMSLISQLNFTLNINSLSDEVLSHPILQKIQIDLFKEKIAVFLLDLFTSFVSSLPSVIISIFVTILGVYYILINWDYLSLKLEALLPFRDNRRISKEISQITKSIVFGYLFIAMLEFAVALTGFYISGVRLFLLLAFLIAILAFVPGLGPAIIWIPTALYYLLSQRYLTAMGVILTGLIISIIIETLLIGRIVGKRSKIHPLIFLVGVLGGVPIFGIFGFIIGPMILLYAIKLIEESISAG